ncbi:hypothetical protein B296_00020677, partial [Ensete ventricosum]
RLAPLRYERVAKKIEDLLPSSLREAAQELQDLRLQLEEYRCSDLLVVIGSFDVKIVGTKKGKRAATVATLQHGHRLLATLAERKDVARLAKSYKATSSKLSTMVVASHAAKSFGYMGNLGSQGLLWPLELTVQLGVFWATKVCWSPMVDCSDGEGCKRVPWGLGFPCLPRFPCGQGLQTVGDPSG